MNKISITAILLSIQVLALDCTQLKSLKQYNGHYYGITNNTFTFDEAKKYAEDNGGYIAIPNNNSENTYLQSLVGGGDGAWIGVYDSSYRTNYCYTLTGCTVNSNYKDIKNNTLTYTNWDINEPNNYVHPYDVSETKQLVSPLGEHWVVLNGNNGKWYDFGNHINNSNNPARYRTLLEFDSQPSCYEAPTTVIDTFTNAKCNTQLYDSTTNVLQTGTTLDCRTDVYNNTYCPAALSQCAQQFDYENGYSVSGVGQFVSYTGKESSIIESSYTPTLAMPLNIGNNTIAINFNERGGQSGHNNNAFTCGSVVTLNGSCVDMGGYYGSRDGWSWNGNVNMYNISVPSTIEGTPTLKYDSNLTGASNSGNCSNFSRSTMEPLYNNLITNHWIINTSSVIDGSSIGSPQIINGMCKINVKAYQATYVPNNNYYILKGYYGTGIPYTSLGNQQVTNINLFTSDGLYYINNQLITSPSSLGEYAHVYLYIDFEYVGKLPYQPCPSTHIFFDGKCVSQSIANSCPNGTVATTGVEIANGECKKTQEYTYYNYLCDNATNTQGYNYTPITTGGNCNPSSSTQLIDTNGDGIGDSCNSPNPPVNNCKRQKFTCQANADRPCSFIDNSWQCSPFPCIGGNDVTPLGTIEGSNDKKNDGWNESGSCSGQIYIFNGSDKRCRNWDMFFGLTGGGCCDKDKVFAGVIACKDNEKALAKLSKAEQCHEIGEYCSKQAKFGLVKVCVQKSKSNCCFGSKLARAIHEQGRPQINMNWGTAESPQCRGFKPEEFQKLDFSKIDLTGTFDIPNLNQTQLNTTINNTITNFKNMLGK